METIIYGLTFLGFWLFIALVLVGSYFIWQNGKDRKRIRKGNERFYNMKYEYIQDQIWKRPVTEANYRYIMGHIQQLGQLQHKNKEMTTTLMQNFFMSKFRPFREAEVKSELLN